VKTSALQALQ